MSAPVYTQPVLQSMTRKHVIEIQELRRCNATTRHGARRGRSTVKRGAIAGNLAEWED